MEDGFYVYTRFKSTGSKKVLNELNEINTLATKINRKKINLKVSVSSPSLNSLISQIQTALNSHTFKIKVSGGVEGMAGIVGASKASRMGAGAPKQNAEPFIRTNYRPNWSYGTGNVYGVPARNDFNPFTSAFGDAWRPAEESTAIVPTGAPSYYSDKRADAFYETPNPLVTSGFGRYERKKFPDKNWYDVEYEQLPEDEDKKNINPLWRFLKAAIVLKALKETTKLFKMLAENGQQIMQTSSALSTTAEVFSRARGTGVGMGVSASALKGSMLGLQNSLSAFSFGKGNEDTLFFLAQLGLSYGSMAGADTVGNYESIINSALSRVRSGAMAQANARYIVQNLLGEAGATQFDTMMGLGVGSFEEWRNRYQVAGAQSEAVANLADLNAQFSTLSENIKTLATNIFGASGFSDALRNGITATNDFIVAFNEAFGENGSIMQAYKSAFNSAKESRNETIATVLEDNAGKGVISIFGKDIAVGGNIGHYIGNKQRDALGLSGKWFPSSPNFIGYKLADASIPNIANSISISGATASQYYGMTRNAGDMTVNIRIDGSRSPYDTAKAVMNELTFKQDTLRYRAGTF